MASSIPKVKTLDNSLALLREGFLYIPNRVKKFQSDIFQTRFLGFKVICLHGQEAARIFYDPEKFIRKGAIPKPIQKSLLGVHAIHTMDDESHRDRKKMFLSLMSPASRQKLLDLIQQHWKAYLARWEKEEEVVLFTQVQEILCQAVCEWVGVPLPEADVSRRTQDFAAMVDSFGTIGLRHWRGRSARKRTEKWIQEIIRQVRNGALKPAAESPLHIIARHKNLDRNLLSHQMAAIELINLLRPTVAISWYVSFSALALHEYPECRARLEANEPGFAALFVQEVRRFYPFAPFVGARVRKDFEWGGYHFSRGTLVFLDIYGTHHDERYWDLPDSFLPDRFRRRPPNPFNYLPQGGGYYETGHRCPGEWATLETLELAVTMLTQAMRYQVPEQDLSFSLSRMPTFPNSKFIITQVRSQKTLPPLPGGGAELCPFLHP